MPDAMFAGAASLPFQYGGFVTTENYYYLLACEG